MINKICSLFIVIFVHSIINAQTKTTVNDYEQPKLVVGIVVDQMRSDYISRFWNRYGNDGFKKLYSGNLKEVINQLICKKIKLT